MSNKSLFITIPYVTILWFMLIKYTTLQHVIIYVGLHVSYVISNREVNLIYFHVIKGYTFVT